MKLEMAPLEGLTTYVYRNAHAKYFGKMDKYYTPFISLHKEKEFNHKELQEILHQNNEGLCVVPQVLTNSAEDFLRAADKLKALGYEEININMGCPSGTVTAKAKGAGMLDDPMRLERFLQEVFEKTPVAISIKTRIGMDSAEEWEDLLKIYNKFPLKELIIHPRVREDFYKNKPNWDAYALAVKESKNSLCYNGDIFGVEDYQKLMECFPEVDRIMLGRGVLVNPFLAAQIQKELCDTSVNCTAGEIDWEVLQAFHDELYRDYSDLLSGDRNILFKMKELWFYMVRLWPDAEKYQKGVCKAKNCREYEISVNKMFREMMTVGKS